MEESPNKVNSEDRISELFYGRIFLNAVQDECKRRVAWMCEQAAGPEILDAGCSQGIVSILLAQKGFNVTGIDASESAIRYAEEDRARLSHTLKGSLDFHVADLFRFDAGKQYDTLVLGEVIEHFERPGDVISAVVAKGRPGARLILTTPFGYKPSADHRTTFTVSSFLDVLPDNVQVKELDVADSYIRMLGEVLPEGRRPDRPRLSAARQQEITEKGLIESQRFLHAIASEYARRLKRHGTVDLRSQMQPHVWKEQHRDLSTQIKKLLADECASKRNLAQMQKQAANLRRELQHSKRELQHIQSSTAYGIGDGILHFIRDPLFPCRKPRKTLGVLLNVLRAGWATRTQANDTAGSREASRDTTVDAKDHVVPGSPPVSAEGKARGTQATAFSILDEFSHECFKPDVHLIPLKQETWRQQLVDHALDLPTLFLAESAWYGNAANWRYAFSNYTKRGENLLALIDACKAKGIPTVFWNKEDPVNFDRFIDAASQFDHIFTTDEGSIGNYQKRVGHRRVYTLPFAAQPEIHNPIASGKARVPKVCFTGAWRGEKYPGRRQEMDILLKPAQDRGVLDIYDRYADDRYAADLRFPAEFQPSVVGSLPYSEIVNTYKQYSAVLNVNSVNSSASMCSRRVFEILACATPVISTPSRAIENMFSGIVPIVGTREEADREILSFIEDPDRRDRIGHLGHRLVLQEHTYKHRTEQILRHIGVSAPAADRCPLVSVITVSNRPGNLDLVVENTQRQRHGRIELIFVANSEEFDANHVAARLKAAEVESVKVLSMPPERTIGECLNEAAKSMTGEYFAKMDDDDLYGEHYLSDMLLPFRYTHAALVGKKTFYTYFQESDICAIRAIGQEYRYGEHVHGATFVGTAGLLKKFKFRPVLQGTDTAFLKDLVLNGERIFSADRFNFVHARSCDQRAHTWQISQDEYLAKCDRVQKKMPRERIFI